MTGFRNKQYLPQALRNLMREFYSLAQGKHRSNQEYYDEFNSLVLTTTESRATIGIHPGGYNKELLASAVNPQNPSEAKRDTATRDAIDCYLAVLFLLGADWNRYGTLVEEIENKFSRNKGSSSTSGTYPTTTAIAYNYLCNYKKDPKHITRLLGGTDAYNSGVAFVQEETINADEEQPFAITGTAATTTTNANNRYKKTCCQNGADGHNLIECDSLPEKVEIFRQSQQPNQGVSQLIHAVNWDDTPLETIGNDEGKNFVFLNRAKMKTDAAKCIEYNKKDKVANLHKTTVFSQSNSGIPSTWYLLDNQSTCNIVSNPKLVTNIRQVEGYMQLSTQARSTTTKWMADVPGYYCPVWFYPGGITNILSLVNMKAKYHVTYDSKSGNHPNEFYVHKDNGDVRWFRQSKRGLYFLDTASPENHTVLLVDTVESNKSKYMDRDYSRAQLARKIQVLIGRPKLKDFLPYIDGNALPNCLIIRQDAINATAIFGRDLGSIKDKTTRRQLKSILGTVANNIPKSIMEQYHDVTLCIDLMFVNRIPFFLSVSRNLRFITAKVLDNRKEISLVKALQCINGVYRKHGFWITNILANSEFE